MPVRLLDDVVWDGEALLVTGATENGRVLCGGGVLMFNRMETNCETSLRMLRKENDRRPAVENANTHGSDEPDGEVIK